MEEHQDNKIAKISSSVSFIFPVSGSLEFIEFICQIFYRLVRKDCLLGQKLCLHVIDLKMIKCYCVNFRRSHWRCSTKKLFLTISQ